MPRWPTLCALMALLPAGACGPPSERPPARSAEEGGKDDDLGPMLPPVEKQDLTLGQGPEVRRGDHIVVDYRGSLTDGTVFDSSYERGAPLDFTVGGGQVIPGWEIGVVGMRVGGKRRLVIPPHLGYGLAGSPPKIGPDATLVFEVELLEIAQPAAPRSVSPEETPAPAR